MRKDKELLEAAKEISQIPYMLKEGLEVVYTSSSFNYKELYIEEDIEVQNKLFTIAINKTYEKVLPLLKYYIINKIKEENEKGKLVINELLGGKKIDKDELGELYPFLLSKFIMIVICIEGNLEEAYSLISEGYVEEDVVVVLCEDKIVILGKLDLVYEHAQSIRETLVSNISGFKRIIYSKVNDYSQIKNSLDKINQKLSVVNKYNLDTEIINQDEVLFEEIIESINNDTKSILVHEYHKGLKKIDNEMIKTIDIFLKCGLNLSESAKELFIHRNTLIYRLDKLLKYTGFDIRNFNEAIIFKIIYSLWKEENKNNIKF